MKNRIISLMTAMVMLFTVGIVLPIHAADEPVNLITNGDFTNGCDGWTNAADGGVFDGTISENPDYIHGDGKALTNKASKGGSAASTLRRYVEAEAGKTYKLSFYVYNTGAATKKAECMSAFVPVKGQPVFGTFDGITFKDYVEYGGQNSWSPESQSEVKRTREDIIYEPGMTHKEFLITVPEDSDYIMISMFAWTNPERLYFSDFRLYEVEIPEDTQPPATDPTTEPDPDIPESGNLITNGDFTNGCTDWTNASNGGAFDGTISDNAAYIHGDGKALTNKASAGGNAVSTLRRFIPVKKGKTYYLSFYVYNTGATTNINECMSAFVPVKGKPVFGTFDGITFKDYVEYGGQNSWSPESQSEIKRTREDIIYEPGMTHKEFLITIPEDSDYIMISIFAWTAAGKLYFSDFRLYETDGNTPTQAADVIRLDPSDESPVNNGEFQGWGTSLCWWANRIGADDDMTDQAAKLFFSDEGLSLDIARFNIGGGDDPTHTHITRSDSNMPGYADGFDDDGNLVYDWNADANQKNVALAALKANPDVYFAGFSNSPPYFMTNSGCSSGANDSAKNNLKDDQYENFAKYLADVTKHLKESGIDIRCLDPMNEPDTNYWGSGSNKQEGCHFDPGVSQSKILVETKNALNEAGLTDVSVVGTDETSINKAITSYNQLSDDAKAAIDRIDAHTYEGNRRDQLKQTAVDADKNLWMSEVDGNWDMFGLADRIITDIHGMRPSAWIIWNIVDRHQDKTSDAYSVNSKGDRFEEKNMPFDPDSAIWGVALGNWDTKTIDLMQKYYGFGQFTKFIKPGMTIIGSSDNTLAAYDKKTGEIAIVAVNSAAQDKTVKFDLRAFTRADGDAKVIRTSGMFKSGEQWAKIEPIAIEDRQFTAVLKARSITTYVINGSPDEPQMPESTDKPENTEEPKATDKPDITDAPEAVVINEFEADENGMSYSYSVPSDMDGYDKYFAVYDPDNMLVYVSINEISGNADGDFTGCTPKLMVWDDMQPKCGSVTEALPAPTEPAPTEPPTPTETPAPTEKPTPIPPAEGIDYMIIHGPTTIIATADTEYEYSVTLGSSDTPPEVIWSVSDSEIAEITNGKLIAKKGGILTITATTADGKSTAIDVKVIGLKKQ
ncbi:MAG: hypothetical protein J1F64_01260 [Oscillospiraceae bacterium]|nr:hypothetical protein [Oscillospiraceae bacterium]